MAAFITAVTALMSKNLRYLFLRRFLLIFITAFAIPITLGTIISFGQDIFTTEAVKGTSPPHPVKTLGEAYDTASSTGRDRIFLINNGFSGGDIDRVLDRFEEVSNAAGSGMRVIRLESDSNLISDCESSARGVSSCFGAVSMLSSPDEGPSGFWNYTIQADAAFSNSENSINTADNPAQVYFLPVQRTIDSIIYGLDDDSDPLGRTEEIAFTYMTQDQYNEGIGGAYPQMVFVILSLILLIPMTIITFHLTGFIAGERESGMAQLIDAMSSTRQPWVSQAARITSNYVSFVMVYCPSWIIVAITLKVGVFKETNFGIIFCCQLLGGLALTAWGVLFGSFFKKSQWSGICAFIFAMIWGILAQMMPNTDTTVCMVFSVLFAPASYVYLVRTIAFQSAQSKPLDLGEELELMKNWSVTPFVFIIFFIIQIVVYPVLGALVERLRHGTASPGRKVLSDDESAEVLGDTAVRLQGFSKIYQPSFFSHLRCRNRKKPVAAVESLDFTARKGQIVALLGANGSGKSTTLDSIGGLRKMTSGTISINGKGGLGIAPQKNVLWDNLTVEEHLNIFNSLKATDKLDSKEEITELIESIGLSPKRHALAKTLSGGQKRKLQLGMMLIGGSAVCCVDEVSSGIDPLSRRNIWDILMKERGRRTLIITTHFLDEADMLADHIAILSKGTLRAEGSSVELKDRLGGGYRVHVPKNSTPDICEIPTIAGVDQTETLDLYTFVAPSSELAATVIKRLEAAGIKEYRFSNPTLEDVFLQLAEEVEDQEAFRSTDRAIEFNKEKLHDDQLSESPTNYIPLDLEDSKLISFMQQAQILFMKRLIVLRRNWVPTMFAIVLPTVVGVLCMLLAKQMKPDGCEFTSGYRYTTPSLPNAFSGYSSFLVGPPSEFSNDTLVDLVTPAFENLDSYSYVAADISEIMQNFKVVETFAEFQRYIEENRSNISSAVWLGDDSTPPTIAWTADFSASDAVSAQNVLNVLLMNTTIASSVTSFEIQSYQSSPHATQLVIFMGLVLLAYPPLLALYPSNERRQLVRGMEYSNGVQPLALWLAYLVFDFTIVLFSSVVTIGAWVGGASTWYHAPYLFIILLFYGIAAVMLAHLIALITKSQLATWALSVIYQAIFFAGYYAGTVSVAEQVTPSLINSTLTAIHFSLALVAPIVSAVRSLFIATNQYKLACDGQELSTNPAGITVYGGPILYLVVQAFVFCFIVICIDGGFAGSMFRKILGRGKEAGEDREEWAPEVADEIARINQTGSDENGLRVSHLTKSFGNNTAVDNVSFGIKRGEVFALLGPNGAGKSTTISLIRGDLKPSTHGGDILVEDYSVLREIAAARTKLGVCPQFDALDLMTVREHLEFYARIRGISNIEHNVNEILRAVGIEAFAGRLGSALSGGNKRKLSLAIALMGNPTVLLLDEPSSGLDAASKRIMWQTLANTAQGRSILLTTHSMEEADALAGRVGIISHRMLALDTPDNLRHRFGDVVHVHLICKSAPRTTEEEMRGILSWIRTNFPSAEIEDKTYHGQIRFSVSGADVLALAASERRPAEQSGASNTNDELVDQSAVGRLVVLLEGIKSELGIGHYSVTPTTLDQVFLSIVRAHSGEEENQYEVKLDMLSKFGRFICS